MNLRKPFSAISLRTRFVLITIAVTAVGLFPPVTFLSRRMADLSKRWFERRAIAMSTVLAHAVTPALELDDVRGATETLRGLNGAPDVLYAAVRRGDGSLLGTFRPSALPVDAPPPLLGPLVRLIGDELRVDTPVVGKGGQKGTLTIGYGTLEMTREDEASGHLVLVTCGIVSLLVAGVFFLIGTSLVRSIRRMTEVALRIAEGDLSCEVQILGGGGDEVGQMAAALARLIEGQREVVQQIAKTSEQLAGAATELYAAAQDQEAAATEQSAGMEEVRRTMGTLLESASHIAVSARGVLDNAERTRDTADATSSRITELSRHTSRIGEILEVIRDIADRSDLLALNASLEATRAGEAGRAFQLVAGEMRRLAERVTASVQDIKSLVADVRASGASTVMATDEGRKLTDSTTESARQITVVTQQQRTGTEQVSEGLRHMTNLVSQSLSATQHTRLSASLLKEHADSLAQVVSRFHLEAPKREGRP